MGDFNLPDIYWSSESIVGHQYTVALNNCFLSTFHDLGMSQIADFPTRLDKTLDLFLTNRPTLVSKCIPLPGVSDHEMVFTISDVRAKHLKNQLVGKFLLWKKADMDTVRPQLDEFASTFLSTNSVDTPVDDLWSQNNLWLTSHHR